MTRTLILMRHAKSSWATPALSDHDRPLNARGHASARVMGAWLRQHGWVPDQVYSSSARRTRETFVGLGLASDTTFTDDLYHAEPTEMLRVLRQASGNCVLMLGHNPGIAGFGEALVASPPDHPRFFDFPTCATLVAAFDITDWRELEWGTGVSRDFVVPQDVAPDAQ